jgi:hypothetical protein
VLNEQVDFDAAEAAHHLQNHLRRLEEENAASQTPSEPAE